MVDAIGDVIWKVTTEPAIEPVTVAEFKAHSRIDANDEDNLIEQYLVAARQYCESYQRRKYITTTITLTRSDFAEIMKLPCSPLQSVTSVKYLDEDGTQQTLSTSYYKSVTTSEPGAVRRAYNQVWPTVYDEYNAVEIIYKAGYGLTANTVPLRWRVAIMQLAAHWFEMREPILSGMTVSQVPNHYKMLLQSGQVLVV